jgi:hypothetical protein
MQDDGLQNLHTNLNDSLPAADSPSIYSKGQDLLLNGHPIHDALNLYGFVVSDWAT